MTESTNDHNLALVPVICSPGNIRGYKVSSTSASLTWDEPYAQCQLCPDAQGYEISGDNISTISVDRPPCEITRLNTNLEYQLFVTAIAAGGNKSEPGPITVGPSPLKPLNLRASDVTSVSALLAWDAAPDGNMVGLYYLLYLDGIYLGGTRELAYALTSLTGNRTYTVELRARSSRGDRSDAATVEFKTKVLTPNLPRNLRVTQNASRTVALAWDAPVGLSPTGYRVLLLNKITDVAETHHTMNNMLVGFPLTIGVQAKYQGGDVSVWVYIVVVPKA